MNIYITKITLIFSVWILSLAVFAQTTEIRGTILDSKTSDPLPFVNIGVQGQSRGTFSDGKGEYHLVLTHGKYTFFFSSVGYDRLEKEVTIDGEKVIKFDVTLDPVSQELNTVVVSGSKYEQKVQESISSIEVMKAKMISVNNPSSIEQAIDKIPGITIIDNEPQIRGGSGFSSGLGSRVMVMVNNMPILRGDAGRPNWGFLPVDNVEQVEVVKGASSVIYGSSAITGAINILTTYPKEQPETKVNSFLGIYSKPSRTYATPWTGINPVQYGISVLHLQKFDNIDLSGGISYFSDQGYIRGTPEAGADTMFNKGEFDRRGKLFFNTRVRNKKIEGLTYGLNGNFMYSDNAKTFFWYDADTNIYRSFPGALSHFKEFSFYCDPYIKYFNKKGNSHSLNNRIYYGNTNANNNQSNRYLTVYNEYQYTRKFKKLGDLTMLAGIMSAYSYSYGQVFSGKLAPDSTTTLNENGTYTSENLAIYCQLEKKFFKKLTLLVGGRWEYYQIGSFQENKPIFRIGLNYAATKSTYFRASLGQGYRAPSIGERYITTNSGNFGFYPNPDLNSETSLSYEVGGKQMFKLGKFLGMIDLSGFYEEYNNYVEFNFGVWGNGPITKSSGFKFLNTGPAQIYGLDGTIAGEGKLFRNVDVTLMIGYTYSVPKATEPDYVYYQKYQSTIGTTRDYSYNSTSSNTSGNILKYRMQNIFKSDLQFAFKNGVSAGFTGRYYSFIKNIDIFLVQLDTPGAMHSGIVKYREEHNNGNFIIDFRVGYSLKDFKFSFLVNNLLNTEYSLRPMTIESPRVTSLQVILNI